MNLKSYLIGLFRGSSMNGELKQVEEAGRQDARMMVGAYVNAFESEAARILTERQQRFIGFSEVEAEYEIQHPPLSASDLRDLRKADLLELAERRGLDVDESLTVAELKSRLVGS